jgi:Uma2 family endonuclease
MADWVRDLGGVPLERILCNPWPGTATEADLLRKIEAEDQLCELIDGTLVVKGMGWIESAIAAKLIYLLMGFVVPRRLGIVAGADGPIRLGKKLVRLPDVAFVSYQRLPDGNLPQESIPSLAMDLAVEILSKSNTQEEMQRKVREYFAAGVDAVWIIDPATRSAEIYSGPEAVEHISESGILRGAGALTGLVIPLKDIFPTPDEIAQG